MMRFLSLQRQILIVMRLGHRSDAFDDRLPVLAFVLAVKHIAVSGAGENSVPTVPDIHRHTFNVSADVIGQAAAEKVPSFAAVTAARDSRIGGVELSPGPGTGLRSRDEK